MNMVVHEPTIKKPTNPEIKSQEMLVNAFKGIGYGIK